MQRYLIEASQAVYQTQIDLTEQQTKLRTFIRKDEAQ
jgi:hypothetical protein